MCGVALFYGPMAQQHMLVALDKLVHRGPDDTHSYESGKLALGFVRLAINDISTAGRQPYHFKKMVGAFNGEIYNAKSLSKQYTLSLNSQCDTHVILPLFDALGEKVLTELDGFYSGIIYQHDTSKVYLLRDHMGKKPLFYGESDGCVFVISELKALSKVDRFEQVPLGLSCLDLLTGKLEHLASHRLPINTSNNLAMALEQAVVKRLPTQAFGIFLSGGLDSSIISAIAHRHRQDITYFVLGNPDNADVTMANQLIQHLGLKKIRYIPLPDQQELSELIKEVVRTTESYNPSIISNGLATYLLARAAHHEGIKVVLTGEGADELFSGYHQYLSEPEWQTTRQALIGDMCFTELRRLDKACMAHSIEARCPFLDRHVKSIADSLKHEDFYSSEHNKAILRHTYVDLLPFEVLQRKKTSCDVGSGIRKQVVELLTRHGDSEQKVLQSIWQRLFHSHKEHSYFFSYPVFDEVIAKRGIAHR